MTETSPERLAALLAEIEDLIRTAPQAGRPQRSAEELSWLGRAQAAVGQWNSHNAGLFRVIAGNFQSSAGLSFDLAPGYWSQLVTMLYEARSEIRSRIVPPVAEVFGVGQEFEYFDEVRRLIELARSDLLVVDPYLDADFVRRYLPHVRPETRVRLLTFKYIAKLLPAVELFSLQHKIAIAVRSNPQLHDRFVFIDGREGYSSGGSFKDGAKKANAALLQIVDAFGALKQTYESAWNAGTVERP